MYKLDTSSKTPIYQQIVEQTKLAIGRNFFQEGDQLPSVREMAKTLLVNESTISKAYKEMETIGIIQTVPGKGTFVAFNHDKLALQREEVIERLNALLKECNFFNISPEEILKIYKKVREE